MPLKINFSQLSSTAEETKLHNTTRSYPVPDHWSTSLVLSLTVSSFHWPQVRRCLSQFFCLCMERSGSRSGIAYPQSMFYQSSLSPGRTLCLKLLWYFCFLLVQTMHVNSKARKNISAQRIWKTFSSLKRGHCHICLSKWQVLLFLDQSLRCFAKSTFKKREKIYRFRISHQRNRFLFF